MGLALSRPATCHPQRRAAHRGLCLECWLDTRAERRGSRRDRIAVRAVPGVRQHAHTYMPSRCPKCRSPRLALEGRMIHCPGYYGGCGYTGFLVTR